ncbi:putative transporter [Hyphodiscus hymeniophilus]|uniref:Transporter n=1 Tax=Hyphodiscus hymeniophilus TaxID=353542 RepID=A0A9P7B0T5_9HELO|nr:putative transporter [Hyphodiscus hymeniophilus]
MASPLEEGQISRRHMMHISGRDSPEVNEGTSLLGANGGLNNGTITPDEVDDDGDGTDIDANEFDLILSRTESYTTGLGIEPESQTNSMLQGPRRYGSLKAGRKQSFSSLRRRVSRSTIGSDQSPIEEVDEDGVQDSKSPFLAGVSVGKFWIIFSACFDSTIMVSSHPVITSYFHSSNSASWLSTAFLLTSTSFQPLFGRLSDTIGRKPPMIFTLSVFLLATVWCALAQSMTSFIAARALCGLGAGGTITLGSIITGDLVPIEIRGAYQSYINLVFGVGSMLGAALGGAIADHLGWRWEFGIQVPSLFICLLIAWFTIPRNLGLAEGVKQKTLLEAMKLFDFKGSILLTTSITSLILGINLGGNVFSWTHPLVIVSLAIFAICFPLFIYVESIVPLPIMPLAFLIHNPRAGLIISNAIGAIIANAVTFNIPLFFQAVLLESATSSGLRLVIPSAAASIVGTGTGFAITYTKRLKWPLMCGVVLLFAGSVGLSAMGRGMPNWAYMMFMVPSSMGQGFMFPASFMAVLAVSEQAEQAVVTSTLVLWRSLGMVLGVASSSLVLQNALLHYLNEYVVGPDKDRVILEVRTSVQAIHKLEPVYREQVIDAYAASLRATFIMAAVLSAVTVLITVRLRLPRLGQRK